MLTTGGKNLNKDYPYDEEHTEVNAEYELECLSQEDDGSKIPSFARHLPDTLQNIPLRIRIQERVRAQCLSGLERFGRKYPTWGELTFLPRNKTQT